MAIKLILEVMACLIQVKYAMVGTQPGQCPLWVKSRHEAVRLLRPLYLRNWTSGGMHEMPAEAITEHVRGRRVICLTLRQNASD